MLFDEEKKEITSNQDCDDFSEDVHSEVSFLIILRPSTDYIGYRLYARCRYDDCNGENNLVKLKQIFHTKYDFALMHEMLEYETESKESEEKTMASPALTTTESKITSGSSSTSMTSPYTQNTQTSTSKTTPSEYNSSNVLRVNTMVYIVTITFIYCLVFLF
ncbi:unnamed protein product [Adineta steineri]|uniref:Uncharacterized protein n=1 Tax=Adineta steineri TaxID=433720 RepID=A0A813STF6_9BILA|nr:unnamed protein product [Adineta steineri]